jgi:hypothetical protein
MVRIISSAFLSAVLAVDAHAQQPSSLTAEELKAIIAKPHDEQPAAKGLEILSDVRNWEASGWFIDPEGKREPFKGTTKTKRVEGKYEVNETRFEGHKFKLVMVVAWDAKSEMYYRYTVPPRGQPSKSMGMRVPGARAIAWADVAGGALQQIIVEHYEDRKMTWTAKMLDKSGAVTLTTEGAATASTAAAE